MTAPGRPRYVLHCTKCAYCTLYGLFITRTVLVLRTTAELLRYGTVPYWSNAAEMRDDDARWLLLGCQAGLPAGSIRWHHPLPTGARLPTFVDVYILYSIENHIQHSDFKIISFGMDEGDDVEMVFSPDDIEAARLLLEEIPEDDRAWAENQDPNEERDEAVVVRIKKKPALPWSVLKTFNGPRAADDAAEELLTVAGPVWTEMSEKTNQRGILPGEKRRLLPLSQTNRQTRTGGKVIIDYKCPWFTVGIPMHMICALVAVHQIRRSRDSTNLLLRYALLQLQKFKCPARLRLVHYGNKEVSEISVAYEHSHEKENDTSVVFTTEVRRKMESGCARGCPPTDIRVEVVDDLFGGDDGHHQVPTLKQVRSSSVQLIVPSTVLIYRVVSSSVLLWHTLHCWSLTPCAYTVCLYYVSYTLVLYSVSVPILRSYTLCLYSGPILCAVGPLLCAFCL